MRDFVADWEALKAEDPLIAEAMVSELGRERSTLRLIASENYTGPAVLAALGSTMNNKYAEGYPGRRHLGHPPRDVRRHDARLRRGRVPARR
jgi:glycine hydroxymethyltransferase